MHFSLPNCRYQRITLAFLLIGSPLALADSANHLHSPGEIPELTRMLEELSNEAAATDTPVRRTVQAAPVTLGQPALFGQWSDVVDWPVIAVHANLLPNGKVLAWDATPDDFDDDPHTAEIFTTRVTLWDPLTGVHVQTNNDTNSDLFCAGSAQMWDGRVLFAGGDSGRAGANGPLMNTSIYDPETNSWRQVTNMAAPRWYSSVAAMGNGELLTYAGTYFPDPIAEVFQLDETWRTLSSVPLTNGLSEYYQWMQTTPEGDVMTFGPQNRIATIETDGNGRLIEGPLRDGFAERWYGSYAMYDIGKVLVTGGTEKDGGDTSYSSSVVIDTGTRQTIDTSPMIHKRSQHNLTILADGSVLATGGNTDGETLISMDAGVYQPEVWSPASGQWREMNDMQINRQYHSVALLLPDGRVLSAGGGYCGDCRQVGYHEQNAEIFSPPYLFANDDTPAVRPSVSATSEAIDYRNAFTVTSNQAALIAKAHLIKLGAATHSQNQDQRLVPLSFTSSGNTVQLTAPDNRNIAPPGYYMLFLVNDDGVPSVGEMLKLGQPLLTSGKAVSKPLRRNQTDEYVINSARADRNLLVSIETVSANGRLEITGLDTNSQSTAVCSINITAGQPNTCSLENTSNTRWKIQFTALNDTSYDLVASLSTNADTEAISAPEGAVVTVGGSGSSGGGVIGFPLLLLNTLLMLGIRRKSPARH